MHMAALLSSGLLLSQLAPVSAGPWEAGWGFTSHGGVPAQPPNLQSFWLNKSVVGYFVSNSTGLASAAELAAEVKLGIVGIGWNLNHISTSRGDPKADPGGSGGGGLEGYEVQQAAALKQARPGVGVMVLRNTEVVSTFWTAFREAMNDTDLWLQSPPGSGKPIAALWGTDDPNSLGPTIKYYLNYSNPRTRQWWLDKYVGPAFDQPNIDGVYTDCSCGTARGERFTAAEAAGRRQAFDAALALAKSKGKWFSAWAGAATVLGPSLPKDHCVDTINSLIALGANESLSLQLQGGWPQGAVETALVLKTTIATFLLVRGSSATIVLPPYDRPFRGQAGGPSARGSFTLQGVDPDMDPGTPLGAAVLLGSVFTRHYTHALVSLDCASLQSTIKPR